jgi:adenylate cyclase, class 2
MPIEIEKKYRLTPEQRELLRTRLPAIGAELRGEDFEENTLYSGSGIEIGRCVLRLRRTDDSATLTYKSRIPSNSAIKHQQEDETLISDPEAMDAILDALGFAPALVYEKRRTTWRLREAEIVIDELPFGLFMEIEAPESEIRRIETELAVKGLRAERNSYPELTRRHGKLYGDTIEARFAESEKE